MKTIRDAISRGAWVIYLNNGTEITHLDHGQTWDAVCPPKIINGKPVYRWVFCRVSKPITKTDKKGIEYKEIIAPYALDFEKKCLDFIIPERELNLFINLNGGIDEYRTDYWAEGYLYY